MNAVVLNGDTKSALAAVRSLGARGIALACGAERGSAMALHSKYVSKRFTYRSPLADPEGFLEDIAAVLAGSGTPSVLFVFSDAAYLALARNRVRWEWKALMPLPAPENIERAFDKEATIALAESLGIPVPFTRAIGSEAEAERVFSECGSIPVVVKPRHSASWKGKKGAFGSAAYAFSADDLARIARGMREKFGEYPIVETYVRGGEYGFECLSKNGDVLAYSAHYRIRSLSPSGGAAVVKETIEPDARMKADAEKILKALSWEGPAMVEFKKDEKNGAYRLIEVNGRFWGSLPLAIFAGTDFPYLYYECAKGNALPEIKPYERGVRSRHFLGDLRNLLTVLFARSPMRKVSYPSRASALAAFFRAEKGVRYDVWDSRDPWPSFWEIANRL